MYFISDTHFWHYKSIVYDNRPFSSLEEMHEVLIKNWNAVVKNRDTIYVLGDFSFGTQEQTKSVLSQLNGRKILVKGNHDKSAARMIRAGFDDVIENECIKLSNGYQVNVSHFPYLEDNQDTRYKHKRMSNDGKWLLHGHVHTAWKVKDKMINLCVCQWNYKPVHVKEIIKIIEKANVEEKMKDFVEKQVSVPDEFNKIFLENMNDLFS